MKSKIIHNFSFGIGLAFFIYSLVLALFYSSSNFYAAFALGSWLILDWLDYRRNGNSILGYFYNHHHRDAFFIFFILATIFAVLIDYGYGVWLSGMWRWVDYGVPEYLLMYLVMNAAYILSMYELFRVIRSFCKKYIPDKNLLHLRLQHGQKHALLLAVFIFGVIFMVIPIYTLILKTDWLIEYTMLLPFLGMWFISDGLITFLHGKAILSKIFRFNALHIISLIITIIFGTLVTEAINLFGGEWEYLRMPLSHWQVYGVPVAVFVGWIPLVLGVIAMVNLIKHLDYIKDNKL